MKGQADSTKRAGKSFAIASTTENNAPAVVQGNGSTLGEQAYKRLHTDILNGFFGAGRPLRLEVLKERYGLSFSPLREALSRLQSERLVVASALRGFRVAELSISEMWDCIDTRLLVEGEALRRSVQRGGDDWEGAIMGTFQALSGCAKRLTALVRARTDSEEEELERRHRDFHAALIGAADSRCLLDMSAQLYAQTERYRRPILIAGTQGKPSARNIHAEHEAIMKAALKRDAARAVELLNAHYRKTGEAIERNFIGRPSSGMLPV